MKHRLRTPFFEIGVKNYIFGDDVLRLALAADSAAKEFNIDVIFIAPYTDIRRVTESTSNLLVFAPYMDILRPGRGLADVLPESLKAAGAVGVVLNHCERPMPFSLLRKSIQRANELDMLSFVCADSLVEAQAIAHLSPDIINPELSEFIGTETTCSSDFVFSTIDAIKEIDPNIVIEQAAGISSCQQVYDYILRGVEGVGVASGIMTSPDPPLTAYEMIRSVRAAINNKKQYLKQKN